MHTYSTECFKKKNWNKYSVFSNEPEKSVKMLYKHNRLGMTDTFTVRRGKHGRSLWMAASFIRDSPYFL